MSVRDLDSNLPPNSKGYMTTSPLLPPLNDQDLIKRSHPLHKNLILKNVKSQLTFFSVLAQSMESISEFFCFVVLVLILRGGRFISTVSYCLYEAIDSLVVVHVRVT